MEIFDLFVKQHVPPANKQHEDFVLSGRKRRLLGYHGYHTPSVTLEQVKAASLCCVERTIAQVNADVAVLCDSHCRGFNVTAVSFDL